MAFYPDFINKPKKISWEVKIITLKPKNYLYAVNPRVIRHNSSKKKHFRICIKKPTDIQNKI